MKKLIFCRLLVLATQNQNLVVASTPNTLATINPINEIIITIEPIMFGQGIKLFSSIKWKYFFDLLIKKEFKIINSIQINTKGARYYHFSKN